MSLFKRRPRPAAEAQQSKRWALEDPQGCVEYRVDELERALGHVGAVNIPGVDRYSVDRLEMLRATLMHRLESYQDVPMAKGSL